MLQSSEVKERGLADAGSAHLPIVDVPPLYQYVTQPPLTGVAKLCYLRMMLKQLTVLVLIVAVAVLGLPTASFSVQHHDSAAMAGMENCDCPPGKSTGDMPCHENVCPPSMGCLSHCSVAPPLATTAGFVRIAQPVTQQPVMFAYSPGRLLSSSYPPYRPPQV